MSHALRKVSAGLRLSGGFFIELLMANLSVARTVLSPRLDVRPGILAYSTKLRSDVALTVLANMITLTPGTLTLDISEDRTTLFIHTLDCSDPEAVARRIRRSFETPLMELEQ